MTLAHNPRIVTDGLVLCLDAANPKSYSGTGTVWKDLSKNGNDGTLVNGVGFSTDNNGAMVFDGTNDRVTIGTSSDFTVDLNNSFTMSVWVYPSEITNSGWNNRCGIFDKSTTAFGYGIVGWSSTSSGGDGIPSSQTLNLIAFGMRSGHDTPGQRILSTEVTVDKWVFVTGIFDADNQEILLYIDGKFQNSLGTDFEQFDDANIPLGLGGVGGINGANGQFRGKISYGCLFDRALTPQEIQQNYNALKGRYGL